MTKLPYFYACFFLFGLLLSSPSQAQEAVNPYKMVHDAAGQMFERIKQQQAQIKENPEILRTIVDEELLPHIDYKFSALKVLGKYYRKVPKEKIPEFVTVFREYLITMYAIALGYYDDQLVNFAPVEPVTAKTKGVTVRAVITDDGKPDIKMAFKVRKTRSKDWKAYDMVAEGISLLSSKQSEFEAILRKDGIDKVMANMRDTISKPIKLQKRK